MWKILIPLILLLLVIILFQNKIKEYFVNLADIIKERGYESAKSTPTVEYNTKTGQWEAVDPKYQSYAKLLQEKYGSFENAVTAISEAKETTSSYETPPASGYTEKDKLLPFTQISGRSSDITPDSSASSDLDLFFQSPASSSSTELERLLKLLAEREKITTSTPSTSTTTTTSTPSSSSTTTPSTSTGSSTQTTTTGAGTGSTQTSTGTSTNIPISAKDFYAQFKPLLQQDVESTVKNELQKQYTNNPVLGEDPCEECY